MDFTEFKNAFIQLRKRAEVAKDHIQSEEATKTSIIMPFFKNLGYDVFNPQEFLPEFTADVGLKKGEKVDYAIMVDGEPVMLIEAKPYDNCLEQHESQLIRYFTQTSAKFAILTNGVLYRFFTDLEDRNKMDEKPFFEFNLLKFRDRDLVELKKFKKDAFDVSLVIDTAEELKYKNLIKELLGDQLNKIDDRFLNYVLNEVYQNKRKTPAILDKFRPWVQQSFADLINERIDERLHTALITKEKEVPKAVEESSEEVSPEIRPLVVSEDEIGAFYTVCSILNDILPTNRLAHRKNHSYFNILVDDKRNNWVARIHIKNTKNAIEINGSGIFEYDKLDDLFGHKALLEEAARKFI
jgi:Uncharacterized conserved protein